MINKIKNLLTPEWLNNSTAEKNKIESFHLTYNDLIIGILEVKNGKWHFFYSEEFKKQSELQPIIDFPDKFKVYESEELWPFFASRIPSINRPSVKEDLEKAKIDSNDLPELLKLFGKKSINNPFQLQGV